MAYDADEVGAMVSAAVGRDVLSVERVAGSLTNENLVVSLDDGTRVLLKLGPAGEIAAEAWVLRRLATSGFPVPELVAEVTVTAGRQAIVLGFVPGSPSSDPDVLREAGRWMRRVHAITLDGWGSLDAERGRGRHDLWSADVEARLAAVPVLVEAGVLDPVLAARVVAAVRGLEQPAGPAALLHYDLKVPHVFAVDGRLTAIIDWGDATVGDPWADLASISTAGDHVLRAFLEGYGLTLDPAGRARVARYRVLRNLSALAYEHAAGGDWFATYRSGLRADVGE